MEIVFLGTSGSIPSRERNLPSILIEYLNQYFLFDCGEGTQRQMRFTDINFMRIDNIFITHLHADHFLGLGGLIQSMDFLERTRTLNIYGPRGMERTMEHMLSMGTFILDSLKIKVHEIKEGLVLEDERYRITCTRTEHIQNSFAYCFEETAKRKFLKDKAMALGIPEGRLFSKLQRGQIIEFDGKKITPKQVLSDPIQGRKIVYTGDTRASEKIVEFARNADILIHDSTLSYDDLDTGRKIDHSSAREAAEIAKKANVKKLYLTHISQRYPDAKKLELEAREIFSESYVAEDLMRIKVKKHDI